MATLDVLQTLQSEVGSRRDGTPGADQARSWLAAQCEDLGLPVEMDDFAFVSSERYRPLLQLAFVSLILVGLVFSFSGQPLWGGASIFLAFFLFFNLRKTLEMRMARTPSQNVIAGLQRPISQYVAEKNKGPAVLLCAHYDTPRNMPPWAERLRGGFRVLGPLALLGILLYFVSFILLAAGWLLDVAGWDGLLTFARSVNPWIGRLTLLMAGPILLLMLFSSLSALVRRKSDSPGADDNGSGTALVVELARRFKKDPPQNLELFFAWWGAEEYGLFGSRQFVRRFHDQLDKDRFYVVNADCVGVGELLAVHSGQGTLSRRQTDPVTLERVERLAGQLGIKTLRTWESIISGGSSDHAEWVNRGYRHAISILRENYRPISLPARIFAALLRIPDANQLDISHIHTPADNIEGIRPQILEETAALAEAYVRDIDREWGGAAAS